jgi:hypothetical protein
MDFLRNSILYIYTSRVAKYQAPACLIGYIGFTWYANVILIVGEQEQSLYRDLYLLFVHICLSIILYCYYQVCYCDPGKIPDSYGSDSDAEFCEKTKEGKARWCNHCNKYKPDRAHHCRKCGRKVCCW